MTDSLFSGVKVIDCGSYIAAPLATSVLAEWGADVIKIEPPTGDPFRELIRLPGMPTSDVDYGSLMENRNKRGIVLDLSTPAGQSVIHKFAGAADIFVTNLPLSVRTKLGIDYEALSRLNQRLIYGSFTGFGEYGAESGKPGFDQTAYWARSGLMHEVRASGEDEPIKSSVGQGDHPAAMSLFAGLVSALYRRERTGDGAHVHSSLMANGFWANGFLVSAALNGAEFVPRAPRSLAHNALSTPYQASDGRWLLLTLLNEERYWPKLCASLGRPDLAQDSRFATKPDRQRNSPALVEVLQGIFHENDRDHWQAVLAEGGIVFEVVATPADIAADQQALANGAWSETAEGHRTVSTPFSIDSIDKAPLQPAPSFGQHTDELLTEAGFTAEEIQALRADGTVA
ncbi:MAG: CaiB/BaiF CoA transferase family protein [Cumulibacter sp.]